MGLLLSLLLSAAVLWAQPRIVVEDAWVRAVPPVSTMSAAFFRIRNTGDERDYLVGVRSGVAETAEIHTTVMEDSMMKMRRLKEVEIPPGKTVEFRPMGKHIMLIDLKKPLREGERVKLTLIFRKSGEISVTAEVRRSKMLH